MAEDEWAEFRQGSAEPRRDEWAEFRTAPAQQQQQAQPEARDEWADFRTAPAQQRQASPEAEGMVGTAVREVGHGIVPMLGTIAGGAAGTVGGLPGMIAGGVAGGAGAQYLQEKALNALGFDDSHQRAVNAKEHPYAAIAGEAATVLPFFGAGAVPKAARVVGGAVVGGLEGARQLYEGEFDPLRLAAQTATGAALAKPTGLTKGIETRVGGVLGREAVSRPGFPAEGAPETPAAREEVHPAEQPAAPRVSVGTSEEAVSPQERKVGDAQNATVRSPRDYPAEPRTPEAEVPEAGMPEARPMTPGEISTAREGLNVARPGESVTDPSLRAALAGEQAMPAEDRAMLGEGAPRTAAAERPADVLRGPAPAEAAPPGWDLTRPGVQAMARRQYGFRVGRGGAPERLQEAIQARAEEMPSPTGGEQAPPLSQPARAFQARMAAQRAAAEGGGRPPPIGPGEAAAGLEPATKSDLQQGLFASLRRMFMPMLSESAQKAGAAIRGAYGPLARLKEQTANRFTNDMHQLGNSMDEPAFNKFVDAYETGRSATLPREQQPLAKTLERGYDDFWKAIKTLPETDKMEATKNFLTHMYDNTNGQVDKFTGDWYGAGGGSLRARTHPTFADARAAGLKQLSNNPIEYFSRYSEAMSGHLAQRRMMADLEGQNVIGYFKPRTVGASGAPEPLRKGGPPDGYAEIKMPWAQKNGAQAYAPRDIAETINQFYAAGLRGGQAKNIYEFAQHTKNTWTAWELGLSAYHATTEAVETTNSALARAMQHAAAGDLPRAAMQFVKAPTEFVTNYLYGRELRKLYRGARPDAETGASPYLTTAAQSLYGQQLQNPQTKRILDIFTKANIQPGNLKATREYDMSKLGNLWDANKRGSLMNEFNEQLQQIKDSNGLKIPQIALDNIRRVVQTISKPLFEHFIPELKLGTAMKDMEMWLHHNTLNGRAVTDEQMLGYARKVLDSTDNRMGEMNMNNLFINKTAKDLATLLLRSFGFTVGGPIREIGGGLGAVGRSIAARESPLKLLDPRSGKTDPRTAYAMAFLPTIGAIGAVYQYMRTGEGPSDLRDFVTPKTGGTIKSVGQQVPERMLVPGYHKDFLGYFVNPAGPRHELHAKLAAPWTALIEQFTGKDWRDKPYVPPRSSTLEWLGAHAQALASHLLPIGPKQLGEGRKEGSALTLPEQVLGTRTPGAYMLNPKGLEAYLTKLQQRDWAAKEKQENRARQERGQPPLPKRQLPPSGYARGGPVLQKIGRRNYQGGSHAVQESRQG